MVKSLVKDRLKELAKIKKDISDAQKIKTIEDLIELQLKILEKLEE